MFDCFVVCCLCVRECAFNFVLIVGFIFYTKIDILRETTEIEQENEREIARARGQRKTKEVGKVGTTLNF